MIQSNRPEKLKIPKGRRNVTMVFTPAPVVDPTVKQNFEAVQDKLKDLNDKIK